MKKLALALIFTLLAQSAQGANWFLERTFVTTTGTTTDTARAASPFVDLPKGSTYWMRPTDNTTNQAIRMQNGSGCRWNHGTTTANMEMVDVDTGKVMWIMLANTNCDFAVTTNCVLWEPKSEMLVRPRQTLAGTDGTLACSGPGK